MPACHLSDETVSGGWVTRHTQDMSFESEAGILASCLPACATPALGILNTDEK